MADRMEEVVTLPPNIAAAVVAVTGKIGTLAKGQDNKFDGYKFASIDDFIEHVRGACHEEGLFIVPQEAGEPELREMKKKDGSPLMMWWGRFAFMLAHKSGASYGPVFKTVMVQANGAQAAGSAQSYALKQFMRGLFLIPTGDDDDPDKGTSEITAKSAQTSGLQKSANAIATKLNNAKSLDALNEIWEQSTLTLDTIEQTSKRAYAALEGRFDENKKRIEEAA